VHEFDDADELIIVVGADEITPVQVGGVVRPYLLERLSIMLEGLS
jgi:hypothetical protein